MADFTINPVTESDYPRLLEVWESSVRATHHFLNEEDIQLFRIRIPLHFLKAVELSTDDARHPDLAHR